MLDALHSLFAWAPLGLPAFLFVITFVVFFHELGHFLVARACGVGIETFSIGFGGEIFGWTDRRGTRWKISWLPLGGYVKFLGDADAASTPDRERVAEMDAERAIAGAVVQAAVSARAGRGGGTSGQFHPGDRGVHDAVRADRRQIAFDRGRQRDAQFAGSHGRASSRATRSRPSTASRSSCSTESFRASSTTSKGKPLAFTIERGGRTKTIAIQPRIDRCLEHLRRHAKGHGDRRRTRRRHPRQHRLHSRPAGKGAADRRGADLADHRRVADRRVADGLAPGRCAAN